MMVVQVLLLRTPENLVHFLNVMMKDGAGLHKRAFSITTRSVFRKCATDRDPLHFWYWKPRG